MTAKTHRPYSALFLLVVVMSLGALAGETSPSFASGGSGSGWWQLTGGARPEVLPAESRAEVVLTAENLGDGSVDGGVAPVKVADVLPVGLKALSIVASAPHGNSAPPFPCVLATLTCTFEEELPGFDALEVRIEVEVLPGAHTGEINHGTVSGGGAPGVAVERPITVGEPGATTPFGVEDYESRFEEEGGGPAGGAGSHPFQFTTTVAVNQGPDARIDPLVLPGEGKPEVQPAVIAKDVDTRLPPGFFGNPVPFTQCTLGQFQTDIKGVENACPAQSAIGVASVTINVTGSLGMTTLTQPVFNLEPYAGEPARFGFFIAAAGLPVVLDPVLRSNEDYGLTIDASNISETAGLISARVTIWGVPGDPRHDASRGWDCLAPANGATPSAPCVAVGESHAPAFLTMPTSCTGPLQSSVEADSWADPTDIKTFFAPEPLVALGGCSRLQFHPVMEATPTTNSAASASGLNFNLNFHDEGLLNGEGSAQSQLENTSVVLPEGFTINPSAGVGLEGCSVAQYGEEEVRERTTQETLEGHGCPDQAKLGTVEIETPLLTKRVDGSIFIAQPYENPFPEPAAGHPNGTLVALYIVAKNPETGILIKLAGKVTPNPATGQLTTTFANNPQLPFDHFNFHFREGVQAPLITPATCGAYTTQALLTPWSEPLQALTDASSFTITSGVEGGACPSGGIPPFSPRITAGTLNNNAGSFSPIYVHLTRTDAEQEIAGFSTNLPDGLTGDLMGIPFCPEADIALARTKTGAQEEAQPSCPAASQIGHTLVGTGVGSVLAYVPGKIYLAGPFEGAPFSILSVTSAVVGPFDLGTVVLRFGLNIDPYTAKVNVSPTSSEPIPTIIDGIVTHVRDIRVYIDRPSFTLNPTSCSPMALSSTLTSNLNENATVASPFQTASCANLKFAPKFAVTTSGKTSKANGASLHVKLTYPQGPAGTYANIARVKVDLPKQLPSRLTTLQKACTAAQFNTNPAGCPAASFIGHAKAITPLIPVPLEGPAIFVSHGNEAFPSLIMVLQGYGVTIDLVGSTFISKTGITSSTFKAVPDQPVGSFELTLPQGKYSALAANGNLCKTKLAMPTEFLAQNGAKINETTKISVTGCPKVKKTKKKSKKHGKRGKNGKK